jgi:hypothetical protein
METFVTVLPDASAGSYIQTYNRSSSAFVTMGFNASEYRWFNSNTERMRITSGGNVLIGTTTDAGYKLDVQGKAAIRSGYAIYGGSTYTSYTANGLWGATATPNFAGTNGQGGTYGKFSGLNGGLILGYQDNGNGLYSPAYGFEVKSVDGRPVGGIVVKAIVMKDIDTNAEPFIVYNNGAIYTSNNITANNVTAVAFFESSSVAFKNILATNPITSLNVDVIKYKRTNVDVDDVRYGYSAEQINSLMPELTNKEATAVKYLDVHTLLIAELQREIKELKAKLN